MSIRYWEFEDAALKEKLKNPTVKEVARLFFDNETEAYRFSRLMLETKRKGRLKLKDVPDDIPIATAKRYLDYAVQVGLLKHEDNSYSLTDRFTKPLRNIGTYIKGWMDSAADEDLSVQFVNARTGRQSKRGGKRHPGGAAEGQSEKESKDAKAEPVAERRAAEQKA